MLFTLFLRSKQGLNTARSSLSHVFCFLGGKCTWSILRPSFSVNWINHQLYSRFHTFPDFFFDSPGIVGGFAYPSSIRRVLSRLHIVSLPISLVGHKIHDPKMMEPNKGIFVGEYLGKIVKFAPVLSKWRQFWDSFFCILLTKKIFPWWGSVRVIRKVP